MRSAGVCTVALVVTCLAAPMALAQPTQAEIEAFVAAVKDVGCRIDTDSDAMAVEEATGFGDAKLAEIVAVLLASGDAVVPASMEGLRLTTQGCR